MHPYYYIRNGQGDVIGLFDANGTIVARYTYDSWGNLLKITDGSGNDKTNDTTFVGYKNPLRYRGYYYDSETKLYYLQSRYYNPEWGRFINADAIVINSLLGTNVFAYGNNNPVMMVDPSGHEAIPYYLDKVWYDIYGHGRMDNPKHPDFVYDCDPYYKEQSLSRGGAERGTPRTVRSPDERVSVNYPNTQVTKQQISDLSEESLNRATWAAIGSFPLGPGVMLVDATVAALSPFTEFMVKDIIHGVVRIFQGFTGFDPES